MTEAVLGFLAQLPLPFYMHTHIHTYTDTSSTFVSSRDDNNNPLEFIDKANKVYGKVMFKEFFPL